MTLSARPGTITDCRRGASDLLQMRRMVDDGRSDCPRRWRLGPGSPRNRSGSEAADAPELGQDPLETAGLDSASN